jgi:hypothetical protein
MMTVQDYYYLELYRHAPNDQLSSQPDFYNKKTTSRRDDECEFDFITSRRNKKIMTYEISDRKLKIGGCHVLVMCKVKGCAFFTHIEYNEYGHGNDEKRFILVTYSYYLENAVLFIHHYDALQVNTFSSLLLFLSPRSVLRGLQGTH